MALHGIHPTTTITVSNYRWLVPVWRNYGPAAQELIGRVVLEGPLTASQERRLPAGLRRVLSVK